jgi:LysR substrate binding domain
VVIVRSCFSRASEEVLEAHHAVCVEFRHEAVVLLPHSARRVGSSARVRTRTTLGCDDGDDSGARANVEEAVACAYAGQANQMCRLSRTPVRRQLELQILVGTRERNLVRGEAELVVQSPRPQGRDLVVVRLAPVSLGLYASKVLGRDARWRITSRETLHDVPLLTYTSGLQMLQEAKWFQSLLASGDVALETNSTHTLLAAALADAGVAVLPRFVAEWHDDLVINRECSRCRSRWVRDCGYGVGRAAGDDI